LCFKDFLKVLSHVMLWKNADHIGSHLDFMCHPCSGCNYADHVPWALHATNYLPANRASCAAEAGWDAPTAPAIDSDAKAFPAPAEANCFTPTAVSGYTNFTLHLLYNPLSPPSVAAKSSFIHGVSAIFEGYAPKMFALGLDQPAAFNDPKSPMLTATQAVQLTIPAASASEETEFAAFVQWALQQQAQVKGAGDAASTLFDMVLEPHSGCEYGDLISRSMYAGAKWTFNEHALLQQEGSDFVAAAVDLPLASEQPLEQQEDEEDEEAAAACKRIGAAVDAPADFVLYFMAGAGNFFQTDALGFSTPDEHEANKTRYFPKLHEWVRAGPGGNGCPPIIPDATTDGSGARSAAGGGSGVVGAFIEAFGLDGVNGTCASQYPAVEPDYSTEMAAKKAHGSRGVCMMCAQATEPFYYNNNPMTVEYAAVYVAASELRSVLSWAMHHRAAATSGYNIDLRLVPLTGCPLQDFLPWALKAGADWRLNTAPLV